MPTPSTDEAVNAQTVTPLVLTIEEASQALRVSKWTVYTLINKKQLATIKIGSRRLVPLTALQSLVEQRAAEDNI